MEGYARRYLRYVRASLADAARLAPELSRGNVFDVDSDSIMGGRLGPQTVTRLFACAREAKKDSVDDERLWPLKILACPYVYALRPQHARVSGQLPARVVPLVFAAKLHKDGSLEVDDACPRPLIPRDYLDPSACEVTLGTLDDADRIYASLEDTEPNWGALRAQALELLTKVTGQEPEALVLEQYEKQAHGVCLLQKSGSAVVHIERLLDVMLEADERLFPLYEALLTRAPDMPLASALKMLESSAVHVGQMECRYWLSISQREALVHHLARPADVSRVLAIDGPPGTGKTTLLLSVIATMWVERAVEGADAPLIVATSTNNQAVVNILEAFAKVKEQQNSLSGRWLPGILSYGQFLPARSLGELAKGKSFPVHIVTDSAQGLQHDAQVFENREGLQKGRTEYLDKFRAAFPECPHGGIREAATFLQDRIKERVTHVRSAIAALRTLADFIEPAKISKVACEARAAQFEGQILKLTSREQGAREKFTLGKTLRADWKEHLSTEPWWRSLLAAWRFKSPRQSRDDSFCARSAVRYEDLIGESLRGVRSRTDVEALIDALLKSCEAEVSAATESLREAVAGSESCSRARAQLQRLEPADSDGSIEAFQAALDLGARFQAFKLAAHYWEARYLIEVESQLLQTEAIYDSRNPVKLEQLYRRLAKLFPCSVATAYTLPARYMGWMGKDPRPLFGVIDLLIVDEAGQVTPEVGVLSFALAKQALVVGDVDQLSPIWGVSATLDAVNALRCGLVSSPRDKDGFPGTPLASFGGSVMRIAQRASPFAQHPTRGRGMLLREHRRCWPEIIEVCNELVYGGLLICERPKGDRKILPSLGYVHIPGIERFSGRSRYNLTEAAAIAKWLRLRRAEIESAFKDDNKPFGQLVAVVTPFVAQAKAIRAALRSEFGADPKITVGTIHALQGAECRVVIFSPTYGIGTRPGSTSFDQNTAMLNVAISRAQDAFLVFGNMHLFRPQGSHPSAVVGRFLFTGGQNELQDVPVELLLPGEGLPPGRLIRDLASHRAALAEALSQARFRVVIVSPFLTSAAIAADEIAQKIRHACSKGVRVTIISDSAFNRDKAQFNQCARELNEAGARIEAGDRPSVHSKLVLVDNSWLIVGSFNWLSSPRARDNPYARYESSIRYDGNEAFDMIRQSLRDLAALIPEQKTG
jgi:hypothetical protein